MKSVDKMVEGLLLTGTWFLGVCITIIMYISYRERNEAGTFVLVAIVVGGGFLMSHVVFNCMDLHERQEGEELEGPDLDELAEIQTV